MINNWHEHLVAGSNSSVEKEWMAKGDLTELNKHALKALKSANASMRWAMISAVVTPF